MNVYQKAQVKRRADMAAEKAVKQARKEASHSFRDAGFLPFGKWNVSNGETVVSIRDGYVVDQITSNVSDAVVSAQMTDNLGGSAIVQRFDTFIDEGFGQEFFVTEKRNFGGINLPCKKFVWTDSKGYILPLKDIHVRMGLGYTADASVCEVSEGEYSFSDKVELSYRPGNGYREDSSRSSETETYAWKHTPDCSKTMGGCDRRWAYESAPTPAQKFFNQLLLNKGNAPEADREKLATEQVRADAIKLQKAWGMVARLIGGQKEVPEVAPLVEDKTWESPVKVMTRADRVAAAKRRKATRIPVVVCAEKVAAKKVCDANIEEAKEKLSEIKSELDGLVPGCLIEVSFRSKENQIIMSETIISELRSAAVQQRLIIREEREEINYLESGYYE